MTREEFFQCHPVPWTVRDNPSNGTDCLLFDANNEDIDPFWFDRRQIEMLAQMVNEGAVGPATQRQAFEATLAEKDREIARLQKLLALCAGVTL